MQSQQEGNTPNCPAILDENSRGKFQTAVWNGPQQPQPVVGQDGKIISAPSDDEGPPLDDLDLMLLHQDFPKLLSLSAQVKKLRNTLVNAPETRRAVSSALSPEQIHGAVARMREKLLRFPRQRHQSVKRGTYPVTDFTIDDCIRTLHGEHEHLKKWMETHSEKKSRNKVSRSSKDDSSENEGKSGDSIAFKYSKWQTDILMDWMTKHVEQPFPDQAEIQALMEQTGLNQNQIVNWTTNVRKRNRKATCEGGKKPHHFIDFMFLLHDRVERQKNHQEKAMASTTSDDTQDDFDSSNHVGRTVGRRCHAEPTSCEEKTERPVPQRDASMHSSEMDHAPMDPATMYQMEMHPAEMYPTSMPDSTMQYSSEFDGFHQRGDAESVTQDHCHERHDDSRLEGINSDTFYVGDNAMPTAFENLFVDVASRGSSWPGLDSIDPHSLDNEMVDEELMHDFAELWLRSDNESRILPSVTEDSYDNCPQSPHTEICDGDCGRKRRREPSFDVEELNSEDIHSWAAELGLAIEV